MSLETQQTERSRQPVKTNVYNGIRTIQTKHAQKELRDKLTQRPLHLA